MRGFPIYKTWLQMRTKNRFLVNVLRIFVPLWKKDLRPRIRLKQIKDPNDANFFRHLKAETAVWLIFDFLTDEK